MRKGTSFNQVNRMKEFYDRDELLYYFDTVYEHGLSPFAAIIYLDSVTISEYVINPEEKPDITTRLVEYLELKDKI